MVLDGQDIVIRARTGGRQGHESGEGEKDDKVTHAVSRIDPGTSQKH
jgi:hypothetical protein